MWFKNILTKPNQREVSTTEEVRRTVREEHAKVTKDMNESIDHLNGLLKETIDALNTKPVRHD